LKEEGDYWSQI